MAELPNPSRSRAKISYLPASLFATSSQMACDEPPLWSMITGSPCPVCSYVIGNPRKSKLSNAIRPRTCGHYDTAALHNSPVPTAAASHLASALRPSTWPTTFLDTITTPSPRVVTEVPYPKAIRRW